MNEADAARTQWREIDADLAATVITGIELPDGLQVPALFHASAFGVGRHRGYLALYGTGGTLHLLGQPWFDTLLYRQATDDRSEDIPVAAVENRIQSGWNRLVADFVADVAGEGERDYPDFRGGTAGQPAHRPDPGGEPEADRPMTGPSGTRGACYSVGGWSSPRGPTMALTGQSAG